MAIAPLNGIRIQLSGAMPEDATDSQRSAIEQFVARFVGAILREGGTLVHGSHPTFNNLLLKGAKPFVEAAGQPVETLVFVRSEKYAKTPEQEAEIAEQRKYGVVQLIPMAPGGSNQTLVPMREWMADRCDVVVAIGGKWYEVDKLRAGVPLELETMLARGRPAFVLAAFGGAALEYWKDDESLPSRLQNGLSRLENEELAKSTDVEKLIESIVGQVKRLPLKRKATTTGRLFRILALDGGGIRGAFSAAVLAQWDEMLPNGIKGRLVDHFDLVSGTSTGAILALGLGHRLSPLEILDFYRKKGPLIFPRDRELRHWVKSKHDAVVLRDALATVYGAKHIGESSCRLVLPTVRANHGEAEAIVTPHSPDRVAYKNDLMVDAALASAAAPTYFDPATIPSAIAPEKYLDGGIWANNPVLPAIAEAIRYLDVSLDRIDVLSIGTLGHEVDFTKAWNKGKLGWTVSSTDLFFAAQEAGAELIANSLLSRARHLRVNQTVPSEIPMDDVSLVNDMATRGKAVARATFDVVRSRFLDGFFASPWASY
jgi:uncharacterized protein